MAEINQRMGQFVQVPRELYEFIRESANTERAINNFFEAIAHNAQRVARTSSIGNITDPTYTVKGTDYLLLLDATGGNVSVTHISATNLSGEPFIFKRIDSTSNTVTVTADGSETIDDDSSFSLYPYEVIETISDGTEWWIV